MTRQQIFSIVFFSLLALLLYQIGLMLKPFLFSALWACLLAHWAFPLHVRLTKLFGGKGALSAGMLTAGALGMVVIPLVVMGTMLVREAGSAEQEIRIWISAGGLQRLPDQVAGIPLVGGWLKSVVSGNAGPTLSLEQSLVSGVKELSHFLVGGMGGLLKDTVALVTNFFIVLLVLFFLFTDGRQWLAVLYDLIPMEESHKSKIMTRLDQTIRAVVKGILVTAIVQGLLAGMAYLALDVPFPMGLTALTIAVAPIPFSGTALV